MNILEIVKKEIKEEYNKNVTSMTKISSLGIDSIDLLEFMIKIEEKFDIKIEDNDLVDVYYIKDIVSLLEKYLQKTN